MKFEDYDLARAELLDYIKNRSDLVSLWEYGEVSQPGVSDLDLVAVIKDDIQSGLADYLRKNKFSKRVLDAMAHANLMVVPESSSQGLMYWDDIQLRDLKTQSSIPQPKDINVRHRRIAMLTDWYFERTYRICCAKNKLRSNPNLVLAQMKSYGYCVDNFKKLSASPVATQYDDLKKDVTYLRDIWLDLDEREKYARIDQLYRMFYDFSESFHQIIFDFYESLDVYPDRNDEPGYYRFAFPDNCTFSFNTSVGTLSADSISVPLKLLNHFAMYADYDSALSHELKQSFNRLPRVSHDFKNNEFSGFLCQRIKYASLWYDALVKYQFNYGLFKFGWYLKK